MQPLQGSKSVQKNGAKASAPSAPSTAQEFAASNGASQKPDNPEDYWTPQGQDQGGEWQEKLGALSPFPDHDGTECLKWDDSLWSHADHFKVTARLCSHVGVEVITLIPQGSDGKQIQCTSVAFECICQAPAHSTDNIQRAQRPHNY